MISLVSVDTTPNPNSMKLNLSEPVGLTATITRDNAASMPSFIQQLLAIDGVESLFATAAFVTLNRDPRQDWQPILDAARQVFSAEQAANDASPHAATPGQVQVLVQTFRQIPIQVKVTDGLTEQRVGLSPRFGAAARELQAHFGADYLQERHWADWGVRYGTLTEVAQDVADEIESLLDESALERKKREAMGEPVETISSFSTEPVKPLKHGDSADWHERLQAVQQVEISTENPADAFAILAQALRDDKPQIRRWAAAKLAGIRTPQSVSALSDALLNDPHVGVRRTAGDSLSDIGDVSAQDAVCGALRDPNKLVRWRAARFLAEVGTDAALPFLEQVADDLEYEVRMEVAAAITHIREGSQSVPVWKLMSGET